MLSETGSTISEIVKVLPNLIMKKYKYTYTCERKLLEEKM